eukprot:TRINITY_DN2614_c0_g1_i1.p1 TRINITY_DN2614_c0_g1~~TRINITY_DN2614_c0_g1_i1.p1  ORF type:complete len:294 (-),score=53.69 TRINITY_DN2614_c0_g1_i1:69-950(-)
MSEKKKEEAKSSSFKYVYVPCDSSQAIEEKSLSYTDETAVGCFGQTINAHFSKAKPIDERKFLSNIKEQALAKIPKGQDLSEDLLQKFVSIAAFDQVPLMNSTSASDFFSVSIYVDDQGIAKGLQINKRATEIARSAGLQTEVRGDVFIARIKDDGRDLFERHDFTIKDLSSDAEWMKTAKSINAARSNINVKEQFEAILASKKHKVENCAHAGCTNAGTLRCSRCKSARYCSKQCQASDWKRHKSYCISSTSSTLSTSSAPSSTTTTTSATLTTMTTTTTTGPTNTSSTPTV